ncbi:MAG: DUF421 domain-containing protein [Bacilli bacterium]|nr:DUF421 domain-containing protein [Bacilli bacterium]
MDILKAIFRTTFFYFFVVIAYRIMGKREISQLQVTDLIVSILMAELIAISIENIKEPITLAIFPIIILVILEVVLSKLSLKSRKLNKVLTGKPSLIIFNGKLNFKELVKQRYSIDDLLLELRQKSIKNISDVEYAFLESNGKLSIFKYNILKTKSDYPMPLILEGVIQQDTLENLNKNIEWLNNKLNKKGLEYKDIFYCFYKNNKIYIIEKSL